MDENFSEYFGVVVDHIDSLLSQTLMLEKSIQSTDEQIVDFENFLFEQVSNIKDLFHDLNLFVEGLIKQFERLQDSSADFVSVEELEELKMNIDRLNFENLQRRSVFKEKNI